MTPWGQEHALGLLAAQLDKLRQAGALLLAPSSVLSLPALAASLALALGYLGWRQLRRRGRVRPAVIWRALLGSRRLLTSPSTRADLLYYGINTFAISGLIGWGIISASTVSALAAHGLVSLFGQRPPSALPGWALRAGLTLATFTGYEFGYYADHYAKHKFPLLWAFHKTHHSAEVLTPLTVFRVHPVDTLIFVNVIALCAGAAHGACTYAAGQSVAVYALGTANVLTVAGLLLLAQLQHSQFWIPLRGWAGRLLLSPAHHQIHHSVDPVHYNRNFGSFLAVWDWMFGTLEVPGRDSPRLRFGVGPEAENPHRLQTLLLGPVVEALQWGGTWLRRLKP